MDPVAAGIVYKAEDYVLSSAAQYAGEYNAMLEVTVLEDISTGLPGTGIANPLK